MKILVIEDSDRLRQSLVTGLTNLGFIVEGTGNGKEGLTKAMGGQFTIIILDLMLPYIDGFSILKKLREADIESSVIILSARTSVEDKVKGLNLGADDYLGKPFEFDELHARINNILRINKLVKMKNINLGEVSINIDMKEVLARGNKIHLTPIEYSILENLAINKGRVISFEKLEAILYKDQKYINKNTLEVHISGLRKKLLSFEIRDLIKTKRGFGYYINLYE